MFQIRTSKPGAGNKNYITTDRGGWNTCIKGKPTDPECNVLANCVGYASGRFNEIINEARGTSGCTYKTLNCNAENFIERAISAGLRTGSTPKTGAIMCWQKGATLSGNDGAGHVSIVEKVYDNNHIYDSESGYNSSAFWNAHRYNNNGRWGSGEAYKFRAFIYLPDDVQAYVDKQPDPPAPTPSDKFKVGDKVVINGALYPSSDAPSPTGSVSNKVTFITRVAKNTAHPYNTTNDLGWMNESDIRFYEEPQPTPTGKFKIGDRVFISGPLFVSSDAPNPSGSTKGKVTNITRYAAGKPHPYNTTGDLGWMNEDSIQAYNEDTDFKVGDKVVITGKYASSAYATSARNSVAIGWTRCIVKIYGDAKFPYQLGAKPGDTSSNNTTGFVDKNSIRKI